MEKRITVHRRQAPIYDIVLSDSFGQLTKEMKKSEVSERRICIVTDSNVESLYLKEVAELLAECCRQVISFVFPAGEEHKNLKTVQALYEFLIKNHLERKDLLVALGGGVVGDLCGFGAATYRRGVPFIQIPTTLLSQVDSSIGGKTGVDFDSYKNMVGAFHMPRLVYTNVRTLLTLPPEQFSSGMGEIIKHGLIKDRAYYEWLYAHREEIWDRDLDICAEMILRSDEIKKRVVEEDPTEQGDRALLNYGHTLGHAIEKLKDFQMLHGHCVGIGALAAARISQERGFLTETEVETLKQVLESFHMPVSVSGLKAGQVTGAAKHDKKMEGGRVSFILLEKIGCGVIDRQVTDEDMENGLNGIID